LLAQGTNVYTWDAANRLTAVGGQRSAVSYKYNGLGQRTEQTVAGVTTEYALDGSAGLPEVIAATASGATTQYVQVQGQILAEYDSGAWGYVLPDHLGSVRTETDDLGQVTVARHFDSFGVPLGADGGSPFGYTGEWWDASAGQALRQLSGHPGSVLSVAFSPDGSQIVSGGSDGTVRLWIANVEDLLELADSLIQRDPPLFTPDELERFGFEGRGRAH
jgi:YD repeat-containing protein